MQTSSKPTCFHGNRNYTFANNADFKLSMWNVVTYTKIMKKYDRLKKKVFGPIQHPMDVDFYSMKRIPTYSTN